MWKSTKAKRKVQVINRKSVASASEDIQDPSCEDLINDLLSKLDFKDSGFDFAGPFVLYFSYGVLDAMFKAWSTG
jgi:hypothetical protein